MSNKFISKIKSSLRTNKDNIHSKKEPETVKSNLQTRLEAEATIENIKHIQKLDDYSKLMLKKIPQKDVDLNMGQILYRYRLLSLVDQTNVVSVEELAAELEVRKTDLMQFILNNRNHFAISIPKSGRGIEIHMIYEKLEDNPLTNEWLKKKIEDNKRTIWLVAIREFNNIMGWRLVQTKVNLDPMVYPNEIRTTLWKNTPEKIAEVKKLGFLHKQQFYFGPYNERKSEIFDNAILDAERNEVVEKFKNAGWTVLFEDVKM